MHAKPGQLLSPELGARGRSLCYPGVSPVQEIHPYTAIHGSAVKHASTRADQLSKRLLVDITEHLNFPLLLLATPSCSLPLL